MSMTGNMELAVNNPFRYRGYYYDVESGLYYLNSRYYDPQTGRFINADSQIDSNAGFVGYNLFAYCANNPVNMIDSTGSFAISLFAVVAIFTVAVTTVATCYLISTPQFQAAWRQMCNNISTAIDNATRNIILSSRNIFKAILDSMSKIGKSPTYRSSTEIHHIVAKKAINANLARAILASLGINYLSSKENLVEIKTGLHRRLHTNQYYGWANSVVISAYNAANGDYKKQLINVKTALANMKLILKGISDLSPF